MVEMDRFEMVSDLNDEDLGVRAFAWAAKSDKKTECMHSCTDSCCC